MIKQKKSKHLNATDVKLSKFRMILQWPLVLDGANAKRSNAEWIASKIAETEKALLEQIQPRGSVQRNSGKSGAGQTGIIDETGQWTRVTDVYEYPPAVAPEEHDGGGYAQYNYFHDFVQKFLFPKGGKSAFSLFERSDIEGIKTKIRDDYFEAKVDRLSLHLFKTGTAIMTLELDWDVYPEGRPQLKLSDAQNLTDHFRRTYTPYWIEGAPQRVPVETTFVKSVNAASKDEKGEPKPNATKSQQDKSAGHHQVKIFDHWTKMIAPLTLLSEGGDWRDPSDERMPLNTFIALDCGDEGERRLIEKLKAEKESNEGTFSKEKADELSALYEKITQNELDTIRAISDNDWLRLADVEEAGLGCPYNPDYISDSIKDKYYDRFYAGKDSNWTVRHIIDAANYCVVGSGWFAENILIHHFRRHYSLLSLIARFEFTSLLAISSRLTDAVIRYEEGGKKDREAYEEDIIDIQGQFLNFVHRYRFTGVSSQLQPREMFARWRTELGLDAMFEDVRSELDVAFQRVTALQQQREAKAATDLNKLAIVGVILGLIVGLMGANLFVNGEDGSHPVQLFVIIASVCFVLGVLGKCVEKKSPADEGALATRKLTTSLTWGGALGLAAAAIYNYYQGGFVAITLERGMQWFGC